MTTTAPRAPSVERSTKETQIRLELELDGSGRADISTGVGFLDHMLDLLARHARLNLDRDARTATSRPAPTTPPRTSGSCSARRSTRRSATAAGSPATATRWCRWTRRSAPCAIDISGRPYCSFEADAARRPRSPGFETELTEEFFRAVANNAKLTVHLRALEGSNAHHMIEACFKAFARALREAVSIDATEPGVPSTKGVL